MPFAGFVYKNVPAFQLKPNDSIGFDLSAQNTPTISCRSPWRRPRPTVATFPPRAFTTIVNNSNLPENPRGDTVNGDYELRFVAQTSFQLRREEAS